MPVRRNESILLIALFCAQNAFLSAEAHELMQNANSTTGKKVEPFFFKMEEHKADKQMVFTLGLSVCGLWESCQQAVGNLDNCFHQLGLNVEKLCRSLDHSLKTNDGSHAVPISSLRTQPTQALQESSGPAGNQKHYPREVRVKTLAER